MQGNRAVLSVKSVPGVGWRDYLELCKPKVVLVMLMTALVGMLVAQEQLPELASVWWGILGIGLSAGSAAAINHVMDRHIDERMVRTRHRPLPQGRISPHRAMIFAIGLGCVGIGLLAWMVNPLTAWLTLASLFGYAVVYTLYLKRATPQNIVIGGAAGAAPPLLGWVAVTGEVEAGALLLVLIIFVWTPPHFWSLCIARKADYAKAGIPMLPVTHGEAYTRLQILLYSLLLVPCTVLPYLSGMAGLLYLAAVMLLNLRFIYWGIRLYWFREVAEPMLMFRYSIKYIMWFFAALLADHYLLTAIAG
jgi:protoheme IX farnesyltransferase